MFSYEDYFEDFILNLKREGNYRTFLTNSRRQRDLPISRAQLNLTRSKAATIDSADTTIKDVLVWCSNDYLGLSQHQVVIEAATRAIQLYGCGSGGTRNISGTHDEIVGLEHELASWLGKESALVFSSGYVANQAAIAAILQNIPNCVVLSDSLNHDSIIQGIRLSRADKRVFRHNDLRHLESILQDLPIASPKLIIFESVYSMDGDFGDIKGITELAKRYNALTFLDETHGVGLYGESGGGVCQAMGLSAEVDFIQGGLGKGVGVVGGFVAGSKLAIDFIRSTARGFIFTTSLPPVVCAAARASINYIRHSPDERTVVHLLANCLREQFTKRGIDYIGEGSHIVPVIIGDAQRCTTLCRTLLEDEAIYLQPINHPTVPKGTERVRITPTALHTDVHIIQLADALSRKLELSTHKYGSLSAGSVALQEEHL